MYIIPGSYTCFWSQVELDKSTWQVVLVKFTCHPRLRPLFKSLDKGQLVKSTCQVNLQGDPPKITFASCPENPLRGVLGGGSGHGHGQKKCQNRSLLKRNRWKWCSWIILGCSPPQEATLELGSVAASLVDFPQQSVDGLSIGIIS